MADIDLSSQHRGQKSCSAPSVEHVQVGSIRCVSLGAGMRRREFIGGLGSAAAWPLTVNAQQPAVPIIGLLAASAAMVFETRMVAFRQGLAETGYVEGQNVLTVSLPTDGKLDRLPSLAAELVRRRVSVIVSPQSSVDRKSTRLNSSHIQKSRMPSSA